MRAAPLTGPCAQFIKEKYWEYEYEEVVTPNIYNFELWRQSGHAAHYQDNMFHFDIEKQMFGLKPMNCPGARPAAGAAHVSTCMCACGPRAVGQLHVLCTHVLAPRWPVSGLCPGP